MTLDMTRSAKIKQKFHARKQLKSINFKQKC